MKITYSTSKINSLGGINFADSIIGNAQVFETTTNFLVIGVLGHNIVTVTFSGRIC